MAVCATPSSSSLATTASTQSSTSSSHTLRRTKSCTYRTATSTLPTSTANKPLKKAPRNSNLNPWRVHASVGTSPANLLVRSRFQLPTFSLLHPKRNHPRSFIIFARFLSIRRHQIILQLSKLPFNSIESRKTRPKLPNNGSSHPPFIQ